MLADEWSLRGGCLPPGSVSHHTGQLVHLPVCSSVPTLLLQLTPLSGASSSLGLAGAVSHLRHGIWPRLTSG